MHKSIGMIVNPMAGRDIRRLVAHASLQSQPEKALTARRIIAGIQAVPGVTVVMPNDRQGFFAWLANDISQAQSIKLIPPPANTWEDSTVLWVNMLVQAGVDALIVVGGDGTQRNVAQAHPVIPVLPIAGGTNNVACYLGDQTAAGLAVARFLMEGLDHQTVGQAAKILHVTLPDGQEEMALVDVALTRQTYTGALAVWNPRDVLALVLARAEALRPGLSNVGGYYHPVGFADDFGWMFKLGRGGPVVPSVLAPGLVAKLSVQEQSRVAFGEPIHLKAARQARSLSLDGERTVVLRSGQSAQVVIRRDGPLTLDPQRIFRALRS